MFNHATNAYGGTEYMSATFNQQILPYLPKLQEYSLEIIPGYHLSLLNLFNTKAILWLHNLPEQLGEEMVAAMRTPIVRDAYYHIIVPSKWTKKYLIDNFGVAPNKITAIPNAIHPLNYTDSKKHDVVMPKFIYYSDSMRGLEMLLQGAALVDEPFTLDIYTNMNPHTQGFGPNTPPNKWVLELIEEKPHINIYGRTNNITLRRRIEEANVFLYPSTYLETSCISLMEAMSAGLLCVVPKIGALSETGQRYPIYFDWTSTMNELIHTHQAHDTVNYRNLYPADYGDNVLRVKQCIENAIFRIHRDLPDIDQQVGFVNRTYSWERIKDLWIEWHDKLP